MECVGVLKTLWNILRKSEIFLLCCVELPKGNECRQKEDKKVLCVYKKSDDTIILTVQCSGDRFSHRVFLDMRVIFRECEGIY